MWPFGRRGRDVSPAHAADAAAPAAPSWSSLPPVQRALDAMSLTVDNDAFGAGLAAQRPPHAFVRPLGHLVSPEAPSGIVRGLTSAVQRVEAATPAAPPAGRDARPRVVRWAPRPFGIQRIVSEPQSPLPQAVAATLQQEPEPLAARPSPPEPAWDEGSADDAAAAAGGASEAASQPSRDAAGDPSVVAATGDAEVRAADPRVPGSLAPIPAAGRPLTAAPPESAPPLRLSAVPVQRLAEDGPQAGPASSEPEASAVDRTAEPDPSEAETGLIGGPGAGGGPIARIADPTSDERPPATRADRLPEPLPVPGGGDDAAVVDVAAKRLPEALRLPSVPVRRTEDATTAPPPSVAQPAADAGSAPPPPVPVRRAGGVGPAAPSVPVERAVEPDPHLPEVPTLRPTPAAPGRRLGLGPPLDQGPPRPAVQRSAAQSRSEGTAALHAARSAPPAAVPPGRKAPTAEGSELPAEAPAAGPAEPQAPLVGVHRLTQVEAEPAPPPALPETGPASPGAGAPGPMVPPALLPDSPDDGPATWLRPAPAPTRPILSAQRLAVSLPHAAEGGSQVSEPTRTSGDGEGARRAGPTAAAPSAPVALVRRTAGHPPAPGPIRSLQALPGTGPAQPPVVPGPLPGRPVVLRFGGSGPEAGAGRAPASGSWSPSLGTEAGTTPVGPAAEPQPISVFRFPSPGDVAVAAGIGERSADGSVVFPGVAHDGDAASPAEPPAALPLQREDALAPAAPAAPAVPAPGAPGAGGDLDDLARRLYPKIRPYLKKELWLDRERAGMLMDSGR